MTYAQTLDFLFSRHAKDMKLGLEHIRQLLDSLGNPQLSYPSIHIAGTNGKGSTSAMLESILRAQGFRTGLYTSPHLVDLRERICVSGEMIPESAVADFIDNHRDAIESANVSFFEILTAMAFQYFADQKIDIAIVETGLGGRLDATNTLKPEVTIITEIGLDHTKILGRTLKPIAFEKAGILKPGIPFVCGARNRSVQTYFQEIANERQVPVTLAQFHGKVSNISMNQTGTTFDISFPDYQYKHLFLRLLGAHQVDNATTVLTTVRELVRLGWTIGDSAVREGLRTVEWPARMELIRNHPQVLIDSAHNPMGMKRLVESLKDLFTYEKLILILGVLEDKDYRRMIRLIVPLSDKVILTRPESDRSLDPDQLARLPEFQGKTVLVEPDIGKARDLAIRMAGEKDLICATGSIYFVGKIRSLWR